MYYKLLLLFILPALLLSSCATILNSNSIPITINTLQPSKLIIGLDTFNELTTKKLVTVNRNKKAVIMAVYNDSLKKVVVVNSQNSFGFWVNSFPYFWLGFIFDYKNPKRFTYPNHIYVDLNDKNNNFRTYQTFNSNNIHPNIIKFTPLKIIGLHNAAIELAFERRTHSRLSTQLMVSYLLPYNYQGNLEVKGFRMALEEKFYIRKLANYGPYVGLELDYLNSVTKKTFSLNSPDSSYYASSYSDDVNVHKQNIGLNLKYGYQFMAKRLAIDIYAGLGIRFKNIKHFDRINFNDKIMGPRHPTFENLDRVGNAITFSLPLNVRLGWAF